MLENAKAQLPKIRDAERENSFGYIYSVAGPGKFSRSLLLIFSRHKVHKSAICRSLFTPVVVGEKMTGSAMYELVCRHAFF